MYVSIDTMILGDFLHIMEVLEKWIITKQQELLLTQIRRVE